MLFKQITKNSLMKIFNTIESWKHAKAKLHGQTLGFVPTMGNLHKGHAGLIKQSLKENNFTVVSIFVNPTQFNNSDDFANYPKTISQDIKLLESLNVDFLFLPEKNVIYNDNFNYKIIFENGSPLMEDLHRPGHFTGVLTVVMKLINIIKPDNCYFGKKDYQQLELIKGMISAFHMDVNIIACETIREDSGLALSSRNNLLSNAEKKLAQQVASIFHQKFLDDSEKRKEIQNLGVQIEYLQNHNNRKFIAYHINNIRLIDNYDTHIQE